MPLGCMERGVMLDILCGVKIKKAGKLRLRQPDVSSSLQAAGTTVFNNIRNDSPYMEWQSCRACATAMRSGCQPAGMNIPDCTVQVCISARYMMYGTTGAAALSALADADSGATAGEQDFSNKALANTARLPRA